MFLAASTRCFSELPLLDACKQISDLEYDKVELHLDDQKPNLEVDQILGNPEHFAMKLRDHTRLLIVAFDLAHDLEAERFKKLCQVSKQYRVAQISLPSSPVGTPFNEEVDRLKNYILIASNEGVRVSIRTTMGCLSEDPRTAVEICQSVKGLGITLDPSHFQFGMHREVDYDMTYPYVFHVHLRDTSAESPQVPVGLGEIDYNLITANLRKENYQRVLSVDLIADMFDQEEKRLLEMRKMRMLIESLL